MSYYAQVSDLSAYLGSQTSSTDPGFYEQMTDRINAVSASSTVGQEAIETAEAMIDGYLAIKYAVPVDVSNGRVAAILKGLTVRMAGYELCAASPFAESILDRVEKLYDDCIDFLSGIKKGMTTLPGVAPLAPAAADGPQVISGGFARVFTEDANRAI